MSNQSPVTEFYSNKRILITGATGFMGKVLVEKLLRSCPDLDTIFLLVRPKRGNSPKERLEDFLLNPVFDNLRNQPNAGQLFDKLRCVSGDVLLPNLNLSSDDQTTLQNQVEIVFNMAANVRFDQTLKTAAALNIGGTKNLLDLVCHFKDLLIFVHVSTAYCHCNEEKLEEKTYPTPHEPRNILDLCTWMDDELLQSLTPKLIKNWPDTYSYTKCLAEQVVTEYSSRVPIVITRPSIVTPAWKEPFPGWVDNLNGPTGLLVAAAKGALRSIYGDPNLEANIVPVDSAINSLILIGWKVTLKPYNQVKVFNITSNNYNLISWGELMDKAKKYYLENPCSVCLWYPGGSFKSNYWHHVLAVCFYQSVPAYLVDFLMVLTRNKPFLVRTQKRIQSGVKVLQYYITRRWVFRNDNLAELWEKLTEKDKEIFYTDRIKIDFDEYFHAYMLGMRRYCLHEGPETLPYARKLYKRLFYLDMLKNGILALLCLWLFTAFARMFLEKIAVLILSI